MPQRQRLVGRNPVTLWVMILLFLLLAFGITAIIFVIAPAQQLERQAAATATAQQVAMAVTAQQVAATATAQAAAVAQDYAAGLAFAEAGDWPAAVAVFRRVIEADAGYADAQAQLSQAVAQVAAAEASATAAVVALAEQEQAAAEAAAAQAQAAAEETAMAAAQAATATAGAPATATAQALEALYARGQGLVSLGRWVEAEAALQAVFDVDPGYAGVQELLVTVAAETAKLKPTATPLPSQTPTVTATPTPSATPTVDGTATAEAVIRLETAASATALAVPTVTATPSVTPVPTPTMTPTVTPTSTATRNETGTATAEAQALASAVAATLTALPPVATATPATILPTATPEPTATATEVTLGPGALREIGGVRYVYVPAGEFLMGSTDEQVDAAFAICNASRDDCERSWFEGEAPQHRVYLDGYWIGETEVTNAEYGQCVATGACTAPDNSRWNDGSYSEHPVVDVDWFQAQAYAEWAGGRLPSEAEWEKAARGSDGRIYPWGDAPPSEALLNFNGQVGDTTPVGSYATGASPYGVLDMAGNVWEWVGDWYGETYNADSSGANPVGPGSGEYRVLRGGSFTYYVNGVRSAFRFRLYPDLLLDFIGFRVVLVSPGF